MQTIEKLRGAEIKKTFLLGFMLLLISNNLYALSAGDTIKVTDCKSETKCVLGNYIISNGSQSFASLATHTNGVNTIKRISSNEIQFTDASGSVSYDPRAPAFNFQIAEFVTYLEAPTISTSGTQSAYVGVAFSLTGSSSDSTATWSAPSAPTWLSISSSGVFSGTPTQNGVDTFDVTLTKDDLSSTKSFTFTVTTQNVAPTSSDLNITINEDTDKTFSASDFNFTDTDAGSSLHSVVITTLPTAGALTLSDVNVTLNQVIFNANIANLVFTPVANGNGTPYTTFGFKVNDGIANSANEYTATINVNAIDDTPTITSTAELNATQDAAYSYTLTGSDGDGDTLTWSANTTLPNWLTLKSADASLSTWIDDFREPGGIAKDESTGDIYVTKNAYFTSTPAMGLSNLLSAQVYKITPDGTQTLFTTLAYSQVGSMVVDDGYLYLGYIKYTSDNNLNGTVARFDLNDTDGDVSEEIVWTSPEAEDGYYFITTLLKKDGYLYINDYSNSKVYKVNLSDFTQSNVYIDFVSLSISDIYGIAFDPQGALYGSAMSGSLIKCSDTSSCEIVLEPKDGVQTSIPNAAIDGTMTDVKVDPEGNIYIGYIDFGSGSGIYKYKPDMTLDTIISDSVSTWSMYMDDSGTLIIGNVDLSTMDENASSISGQILKINTVSMLSGTPSNADVGDHNISLALSDGTTSIDHNFTITVANVNDLPTSSDFNITIDEDTNKTFESNDFNFTDIDAGSSLHSVVITTLPSAGALTLSDVNVTLNQVILNANIANLVFTPVANANGTPYTTFGFKVNDGDANSTNEYTATINVTSVDDAPILEAIENQTQAEDFTDLNITLNASDADTDDINYTVTSSNTAIATVTIVDGKVVVTPVSDANGVINIEVNATANGQTVTQTFDINITNVNDIPTLASISNILKDEDFSDFNITITPNDVDSDNLKLTVDMNDSTIISIPVNSTDWITNANYSGGLTLPITAIANKSGITELNVTVEDPSGEKTSELFTITVTPKDDAPVASSMAATVGPNSQNTFDKFTPTFSDVDGDMPNTLKIETLPTVGTFEEFNTTGNGEWSEITAVPFEVAMSDLANYRFNAGDNSGQNADVNWSIRTTTLWSNTATGVVTIIDPANNLAPDVNLSVSGIVTIDEDSKTNPIYITFADDYTQSKFLVGVIDSNDSSKVSLNDGDFNITRISDNNVSVIITPKANVYGDVNITLGAFDGDKNGTKSFTLHINSINDIPTAMNFEKTINEDNNYSFSSLNPTTLYSDTNDSSQDINETYPDIFQIVTLPQHGSLHLGDSIVLSADTNLSISNLGSLVYTPQENNNTDVNFTWRAYDGETWTQTKTATIHIDAVDDAPTLQAIDNVSSLEDADDLNITLNATDADGDAINYTVTSSNTAIATVAIVDGKVVVTSVSDASGVITVEVNATANGQTATQSFDLNITAVDDAPYFTSTIPNQNINEDAGAYSLVLSGSATDKESDAFTYRADSNDTSKVVVSVASNSGITITPQLNATGVVRVDVNVTQDSNSSLYNVYSFNVTLNAVNDRPVVTTAFNDISINEDNGTTSYDLNVSDIEGDDLNISVDSNNTDILRVTTSWTNANEWISQASHTDFLDFNLTTQPNANGMVRITITVDDSELNSTRSFDVNVSAVNDAPHDVNISNTTITENAAVGTNVATLSSSDIDSTLFTYSLVSGAGDSDNALFVINGSDINTTEIFNYESKSSYSIRVRTTDDANLSYDANFTITVVDADDTPVLESITNTTTQEDSNITIDLNATDADGDAINYTVTSSNTAIATVAIVDGKVVVTPVSDANGVINIEVNATANSKTATQSFDVEISAINDAPTIDTAFSDLNISEDALSFTIDMNVSDIEGDDLNITVSSDNETLLSVTPNFNELLTQGEYGDITLDFNLTTVANAYGVANITVTIDDAELSDTKTFVVTVNALNDAPLLANISDTIVYRDALTKNITLSVEDIDSNSITYSATIIDDDASIVDEISFNDNNMSISVVGNPGNVDINVTATDGELNSSRVFNFYVLPLYDGEDAEQVGNIDVVSDANGTTTTLGIDDNLSIQTQEDVNGTVSHLIEVAGTIIKSVSELNNSTTEFTPTGVQTKYSDENLSLEVNATLTGQATHEMTIGAIITKAVSEFLGAQTRVAKDVAGLIEIVTSVQVDANTTVSVIAKADATAEHRVTYNNKESKVISSEKGALTLIKTSGDVQTTAGSVDAQELGFKIKAVVTTNANGETTTQFIKVSVSDESDFTVVGNTLEESESFESGNQVEILTMSGVLCIQTQTKLENPLVIE